LQPTTSTVFLIASLESDTALYENSNHQKVHNLINTAINMCM